MTELEVAVDAHAAPCVWKIKEGNASFFVLAIGVAFENKTIDTICLTKVTLVVLAFVIVGDFAFELKESREKRGVDDVVVNC